MYKKIFFILIHCCFISLLAQDVPIGHFKEYLHYNKFHSVAQDSENIYAATSHSILVVDKKDGSLEKWSKINGLSEVGIQTIHSDSKNRLIIAYKNSNIDIIQNLKVHNVRDILNKQISGTKTINRIFTSGDLAYFACDFGVVILDLKSYLVKDTWFTVRSDETYRVNAFAIHNERYYIATHKGVFSLPVNAFNPADFSTWTQESQLAKASFKLLCSYKNKLFCARSATSGRDSLFVYENNQWHYDNSMGMYYYRHFDTKNDKLLICDWEQVKVISENSVASYTWNIDTAHQAKWRNGNSAIFDEKMNLWVADNTSGLIYINTDTKKDERITAEGPISSTVSDMYFSNGTLIVVPGVRSGTIVPSWERGTLSIMKDDKWWYRDYLNSKTLNNEKECGFNSVAINPLNPNEIYVASWHAGLFKINKATNNITLYNKDNSPLVSTREKIDSIIFVSGLVIDNQNRLWMAHTDAAVTQIKVKDLNASSDKWDSIRVSSKSKVYAEHILIDSRNFKWITLPVENELYVFFENGGALNNTAVHRKAKVDLTSQANVPGTRITCLAEDREGNIWTGCNRGIKVIYDAASVFNRTLYAKNILIEQNGYVQNLFEFEYVTCIAVDAANRKWVGTQTAGVFLVSPTGTEELIHFTTENSPLLSNQINDIKINPENGEVFFATQEGLMSYRGTATTGKENYKEVLVFPNPVRENYYGPVAVKGLMEDSFCKITDATGNLVWQGYAYGGQLIWNGKDFNGKRPATGVYFVMAANKTGKIRKVAKFLFVQ